MADYLYAVQWSDDGTSWWTVTDQQDGGGYVTAVYLDPEPAVRRRNMMADAFEDRSYRVIEFEPCREVPTPPSHPGRGQSDG